ncbi:MAG: corrinoid protein [Kiritimatiellae bacterium]|jgi:5-methyltetrahydrofolate--homocysteine methyltransferase|nr:corrinoid protein [Kiritimatiellia bacterium]
MADFEVLRVAMKSGKVPDVTRIVNEFLDAGEKAEDILNQGLLQAMTEVGKRFKANEVFVPEVLIAARAMKAGTEILKPHLVEAGVEAVGTAIMGTVKGDLHDIGKNLVIMMLEGAGFNVIDAGVDVSPEKFVALAKEHNAHIVGLSALLTTTMPSMKAAVDTMRTEGVTAKIIIGGAPVTQTYCDSIGADGYSEDAAAAAELALSFIGS